MTANGEDHVFIDGGFTDWTRKLLGSRKERFLASGVSTDYLVSAMGAHLLRASV